MLPIPEAYQKAVTSLTAKHLYAIGYGGDDDPGYALEGAVLYNSGTVDLHLAGSLTGATGSAYATIKAGTSVDLEGPREGFVLYNAHAATAASFTILAQCYRRNAGRDGGMKARKDSPASSTRYYVARPAKVAGATTTTTLTVRQRCTITGVKNYSVSVASGATITLDVLDRQGRSLLSTPVDLEGLVTATLTAATLTASTGLLTLEAGDSIVLSYASSAGGDTLGDLLTEIAITEA